MTKWTLPEGRKPMTDADMADLTRRLADTVIEQSELYQAAKRDAEEAEAYAKELETELHLLKTSGIVEVAVRNPSVMEYMKHWEGRAEAAEAKLGHAGYALQLWKAAYKTGRNEPLVQASENAEAVLEELKGEKDE